MKLRAEHFIFDMDGLMIDSEKAVYGIWQEMFERDGLPLNFKFYKQLIGMPDEKMEGLFLDEYGKDFDFWAYMNESIEIKSRPDFSKRAVLKPGLVELLTYLKNNGKKTTIATSSTTEHMLDVLSDKNILHMLDFRVCYEDTERHKPEPDVFLKALEKAGAAAEESIVLEDSQNGLIAASRANIRSVFVEDLVTPSPEVLSTVMLSLNTLDELIPYLEGEKQL